MFNHITLGSNDIDRSRAFYDAALGALGVPPGVTDDLKRLWYLHDGGRFLITRPIDGQPATGANGGTIAFRAADTTQVDAWQAAGTAHGGMIVLGPPKWRERPGRRFYVAYLRDPDGNKICAVHNPARIA